jgi:hypothetical protein
MAQSGKCQPLYTKLHDLNMGRMERIYLDTRFGASAATNTRSVSKPLLRLR